MSTGKLPQSKLLRTLKSVLLFVRHCRTYSSANQTLWWLAYQKVVTSSLIVNSLQASVQRTCLSNHIYPDANGLEETLITNHDDYC